MKNLKRFSLSAVLVLSSVGFDASAESGPSPQSVEMRLCENLPLWRMLLKGKVTDGEVLRVIQPQRDKQLEKVYAARENHRKRLSAYIASTVATGLTAVHPSALALAGIFWGRQTVANTFSGHEDGSSLNVDFRNRIVKDLEHDIIPVEIGQLMTNDLLQNESGRIFIEHFGSIDEAIIDYGTGIMTQFFTRGAAGMPAYAFYTHFSRVADILRVTFLGWKIEKSFLEHPTPHAIVTVDFDLNQLPQTGQFCTVAPVEKSK